MIAGYVGKNDDLDEAMVKFSYSDETEKDYKALVESQKSRIKVASSGS